MVYTVGNLLLRSLAATSDETLFSIHYGYGFNLHFESSAEELVQFVPHHLKPIKIRHVISDQDAKYLVSMYMLQNSLKGPMTSTAASRIDILITLQISKQESIVLSGGQHKIHQP